ncbi:MAG: bifunctional (p)ppGpp synthetase/guanosine-3',5'-bis(diphosphate) 3'-pyrophosphohydrolase, partial [Parvularculaceae bacterium]|nr:bifunctional (p)ppGpp synthetase/guanosine-3',5'-bis(diphosphate) 3'-pyrophosphohydrolase [Parvularculaceae bacterium]
NSFAGARVNGRQVPNRTTLKNGDLVWVHTAKDAPITTDWERYVVTGSAKLGLRKRMKAVAAKEQRALGERIIRNIFSVHDVPYSREAVREAAKRMGYKGIRSLLEAVGRLEVEDTQVLDEVYPSLRETQRGPGKAIEAGAEHDRRTISIDGIHRGASITLGPCCSPLPGERIVGVADHLGRVMVHRVDCDVLADQREAHWIDLAWKNDPDASFVVEVVVTVTNRTGALGHIGNLLAKYETDVHDLRVENREVQFSDLRLQIEVTDSRHLANVLTALRGSDFVVAVERSEGIK